MRVSSTVQVTDHWKRYRGELEQGVAVSLMAAARTGMVAGQAKSSRYNISKVQHDTRIDVPVRHPRGWYIVITWTDFRARFFEWGTYEKLGRRLTARSKQGAGGNRGVKPQRFMALARRVGRLELLQQLSRNLR